MSTLAVVAARLVLQTDSCPATNPNCASRAPAAVVRKPIFQGFGVHEFLLIGGAAVGTFVGLIVVTWLLVHLTGAHRDYVQLPSRGPGGQPGMARPMGADFGSPTNPFGPRRTRPVIANSTWVGVALVFTFAVGAAAWVAFRGGDSTTTTTASTTRTLGSTTTVAAVPVTTPSPTCPKPALAAAFVPPNFDNQLAPGFGAPTAQDPGCAFHWQGNNGVVSLLPTGYSPLGPPGVTQQKVVLHGRTLYVGPTPDGGLGVVIEDKELGGAADVWYTLMSTTVSRNDLIETAADLQRT